MAPSIPASKIIKSYHSRKIKHFYNSSVGLPYLEEHQQFRKEEFEAGYMEVPEFKTFRKEAVVMGIDQGNNFHILMGFGNSKTGVVTKAQRLLKTDDLEEALELYRPDLTVMDMFPDQHYAKKLQQRFGYRKFLLVNQRMWRDPERLHNFIDFNKMQGVVNLERTEALDRMYERIREGSLRFLVTMTGLEDLYENLKNLVPDLQEKFGRKKKVYQKLGKEDLAHALDYFSVGLEILYPNSFEANPEVVPASILNIPKKGTKEWIAEDFERTMRQSGRHADSIIIPPTKRF